MWLLRTNPPSSISGKETRTVTVINTNSAALRAQNASRTASMSMSSAMERLSSGKRIN